MSKLQLLYHQCTSHYDNNITDNYNYLYFILLLIRNNYNIVVNFGCCLVTLFLWNDTE